jgi:hypothetical protein
LRPPLILAKKNEYLFFIKCLDLLSKKMEAKWRQITGAKTLVDIINNPIRSIEYLNRSDLENKKEMVEFIIGCSLD